MPDYSSTARALALPIDDEPLHTSRPESPTWHRRSLSRQSNRSQRPQTVKDRWLQRAERLQRQALKTYYHFTPLQRAGFIIAGLTFFILTVLFLVYNEKIFAFLDPYARKWRQTKGAWTILWLATFLVSFPPMIGYSTCVTIAGFVYGMNGWFIVSTATVIGSTCSFLVSRTVLKGFVARLTANDKRFAALSLTLKHDGMKLLIMIRLCPLPYSLSNGAISTIPTVTWQNFMLATAVVSPKLLLHVFVGSQLSAIAENGDKMDSKTKAISYISIAIGILAGIGTGYFMYTKTKARARQLEEEEAEGAVSGRRTSDARAEFIDDDDEQEAVDMLRRDDDISLHRAYEEEEDGYRDDFTDDEDARDVFDDGDGDEEEAGKKAER